jgi:hypothetical protein
LHVLLQISTPATGGPASTVLVPMLRQPALIPLAVSTALMAAHAPAPMRGTLMMILLTGARVRNCCAHGVVPYKRLVSQHMLCGGRMLA